MSEASGGPLAAEIAKAVSGRKMSALEVTEAALARIEQRDTVLNSFTDVTAERARSKAKAIDAAIAAGKNVGPLAGVPFAVKNLFDVQGLSTRAGSRIIAVRCPYGLSVGGSMEVAPAATARLNHASQSSTYRKNRLGMDGASS